MARLRPDLSERGETGLRAFAGQVSEAYTSQLRWPEAYATYDEMRRRDPTVRAILNALILLARTASWYFEVGGERTDADKRAAEFMETCIRDMSLTIEDAIEDALSCVWFGWSWQEICYKRRQGPRGRHASAYDDGLIGWRKWAERRQSAFDRWEFDEAGGVRAMVQRPAPNYVEIAIPIEKSLHYRGQRDGTSPEGWALAESIYEPWYFLKNLHIISGIGWQRTFVGLPVFEFEERPDDDDVAQVQSVGQALTVDEKQYVSVPSSVKFRLESASNAGAASLLEQIKYERRLIMQTLLADFLDLGTGQTGSWALGSDKSQLFLMAVDGLLDRMSAVINRFGVRRLMAYNAAAFPGLTGDPVLAHKRVEKPALAQLGSWLQQVQALLTWSEEDEAWLRHRVGMPTITVREEQGGEGQTREGQTRDGQTRQGQTHRFAPTGDAESEMAELASPVEEARDEIEEALEEEISDFLGAQAERVAKAAARNPNLPDDAEFWTKEERQLAAALLSLLVLAVAGMGEARARGDPDVDWSDANAEALDWVSTYTFDLVRDLTETTREQLRRAMKGWLQAGGDVADLARMLEPTFSESRARAIAATEATRAASAASREIGAQLGVRYVYQPPTRTNCRCWTVERRLPDGTWVGVWMTANDERVSTRPLETPWGVVQGDRALHGVIVSEGPWLGRRFDDVAAEMR